MVSSLIKSESTPIYGALSAHAEGLEDIKFGAGHSMGFAGEFGMQGCDVVRLEWKFQTYGYDPGMRIKEAVLRIPSG